MTSSQREVERHEYWAQWSPEAHARFGRIERIQVPEHPRLFSLAPSADLPAWVAELTAGRLGDSDAPTLSLGNIVSTGIDWGLHVAEHPGDVVPAGPGGPAGPDWAELVVAYDLLRMVGLRPFLELELEVLADARLGLVWNSLGTTTPGRMIDDATWSTVCALLAPADVSLPVSRNWARSGPPTATNSRTEHSFVWLWGGVRDGDGICFDTW